MSRADTVTRREGEGAPGRVLALAAFPGGSPGRRVEPARTRAILHS